MSKAGTCVCAVPPVLGLGSNSCLLRSFKVAWLDGDEITDLDLMHLLTSFEKAKSLTTATPWKSP